VGSFRQESGDTKVLLAAAGILILGFIAIAVVGVSEAQTLLSRLDTESDAMNLAGSQQATQSLSVPVIPEAEAVDEARFTSSLLALSKVQTQVRSNSPELVRDESSSLVSVPLAQSKNPVRVS
jgi:hypothetical protein